VLFVDLDLFDAFDGTRVEQLGMRGLAGLAREVAQSDEVDGFHEAYLLRYRKDTACTKRTHKRELNELGAAHGWAGRLFYRSKNA
jgi:hypothetical protein